MDVGPAVGMAADVLLTWRTWEKANRHDDVFHPVLRGYFSRMRTRSSGMSWLSHE